MSPIPARPPAPATPPATHKPLSVKTVLTDLTAVLAAVTTVGEGILAALPSGALTTGLQVALPVLTATVAGLRKVIPSR